MACNGKRSLVRSQRLNQPSTVIACSIRHRTEFSDGARAQGLGTRLRQAFASGTSAMLSDTANSLVTNENTDRYCSSKPMILSRAEFLTYHFVHLQCSRHLFSLPSLLYGVLYSMIQTRGHSQVARFGACSNNTSPRKSCVI